VIVIPFTLSNSVALCGEGTDYLDKDQVVESPATTWL
jgi:hypothetical protein